MFKGIFYKFSAKSRKRKSNLFFELMSPSCEDILLDAGGGRGIGFREIWNYFKKVIVVDLDRKSMEIVSKEFSHVEYKIGDVCNMPVEDKSVDIVFSNAVIEHIDREKRHLFAKEVRRVAKKGYFIATPNYWFPFEPHYMFPFFQYLPECFKKIIKKYVSLGYFKKGEYEKIDLLTKKELKNLFPEAKIIGIKFFGIVHSWICWYKKS